MDKYLMKTYVTLKKNFGKYNIKITQKYSEEFNRGHYIVIFEDNKGNIVDVISTTCGQPEGKINDKDLDEYIKGFKKDLKYNDIE